LQIVGDLDDLRRGNLESKYLLDCLPFVREENWTR